MPDWQNTWPLLFGTDKCSYKQDGAPDAIWCPNAATGRDQYGYPACPEHGGPEKEDEEEGGSQDAREVPDL